MTKNTYIISIEQNVLVGKPSGHEREHSLVQKYPKECNYSLMMHGIRYVYSFFYLDYHFDPGKFLSKYKITARDDETMACVLSCAAEVFDEKVREV